MVEPTESESLDELDRFIEAMNSIKSEIDEIRSNKYTRRQCVEECSTYRRNVDRR